MSENIKYLNPQYTNKQVNDMVIDQWHLWLGLNPPKPGKCYAVTDHATKEEPRRVTYFRTFLQAEGLIK